MHTAVQLAVVVVKDLRFSRNREKYGNDTVFCCGLSRLLRIIQQIVQTEENRRVDVCTITTRSTATTAAVLPAVVPAAAEYVD